MRKPFLDIISSENNILFDYGKGGISSEPLSVPYQDTGEYILTITSTDDNGCSTDTSILVKVVLPLSAIISPRDTFVDLPDLFTLGLSHLPEDRIIHTINWEGDSVSCKNCFITEALPLEDGYYHLSIIDEYGCQAKDSIWVRVNKNYGAKIYVPNAFRPNGANRIFYIYANPNIVAKINHFRIFSRWGEKVFECPMGCKPNDPNYGWDGTFKGKEMNPGIFIWTAEIEFIDGVIKNFTGEINLIK